MLRHKRLRLALAAFLVAGLFVIFWLRFGGAGSEPSYQGRPLSFWVQQSVPSNTNLPFGFMLSYEGGTAVREIGTNALPTLLRWMRYPDHNPGMKLANWLHTRQTAPGAARFFVPSSYQPANAVLAFQALGTNAAAAIPALVRMLHVPQDGRLAGAALCAIGPDGVAAFGEALPTVEDGLLRANILSQFFYVPPPELQQHTAPILAQRLKDDPSAAARMSAAQVLGNYSNAPTMAVTALAGAMRDRDGGVRLVAANGLGRFGRKAISAVPALEAALTDQNPQVRANATNALLLIQGR